MNHLWCHQKCIIGAAATHFIRKKMNELKRTYHATKANESSKQGSVDNITNIQMETERFWLSHQLFQTYGLMLSHKWSIWMFFFVTFHSYCSYTYATTSELFMSLSFSSVPRSIAHFPLHPPHFPAQALPTRGSMEYCLNEQWWTTQRKCKWRPLCATLSWLEVDLENNALAYIV